MKDNDDEENGRLKLVVTVQDEGLGMDENECRRLFKPFFRTHNIQSRQLNPSGIGLGL